MDESEPEAEREEEPAAHLVDLPVDQRATEVDTKPATRWSLRVKGGKADLASLPYKGRPI